MRYLPYEHAKNVALIVVIARAIRQRVAGLFPKRPATVAPAPGRRLAFAWAGIVVGLLGQLVLVWLGWQLVDLCISLMEVWAELATKHLEIVLDES